MTKNEAVFLPVNCIKTHKTFYARYDFAYDEVWVLTYGLKEMPSDTSGSSGSSDGMSKMDLSDSRVGPQYKCPYCGSDGFVRCGQCRKLTCYAGGGSFTCDHCGHKGQVGGTIESLEGNSRHSQL